MVLKSFSSCIKKKEPRAKKKIFSQDVGAYIYVWIFENGVKELHPRAWFHWTLSPSLGPKNGQIVEKGGERKQDKRAEEEKRHWLRL